MRSMPWLAALLTLSLCAFSQRVPDSVTTAYDSLQDLRFNRFERQIGRQLEEMEMWFSESNRLSDSLSFDIDQLNEKTGQLERAHQRLDAQLLSVRESAERSSEESMRYREHLERTLWIAGTVLVVLIITSLLFLLIYTLRTRWMLERLKARVNKLRKSVREQRKKLRRAPGMQKKAIRKITRSEVQSRIKGKQRRKK